MKPETLPSLTDTDEPPEIDLTQHEADLQELGIVDQKQAEELLGAIIHIMSICVDIGWGVDIVQIMLPELFREIANDNETPNKGGADE